MRGLQLIPEDTSIKFMRLSRLSFPFSALMSLVAIAAFVWIGLNLGIDFKGGTVVEMRSTKGPVNITEVRSIVTRAGFPDAEVQEFGGGLEFTMRFGLRPGGDAAQQEVVRQVRTAFAEGYEERRVEVVGPRVSAELVQNGTLGVLLSILGVLIYLWFRFEWQFAAAAVVATMHDLVLTVGFFAVTRIDFDMNSIAAVLTIVGYSLNDTVVIFDRIRELMRKYKRMPVQELLDLAINQTLARTIKVSFTAALALMALAYFGGQVIESFSFAMLFGVVVGTYSTIFIATPVLIYFGVKIGQLGGPSRKAAETEKAVVAR